jgi:hypothetical protein
VASEWRSRCAPLCAGWRPARASARRTIVPTAWPSAKPRRGARIRTKTCRVALGGLPVRREATNAAPTSCGSGRRSWRAPLLRTRSSPASQSRSSRVRAATSPARKPSRANRSKIAESRRPCGVVRSPLCKRCSTSSAFINLGRADKRQFGTVGTAVARSVAIAPRWSKKRQKLRRAVAINLA